MLSHVDICSYIYIETKSILIISCYKAVGKRVLLVCGQQLI